MEKPLITFVSPKNVPNKTACECADILEKELGVMFNQVDTVLDLFPLLSDPSYHADIVAIDLEKLTNRKDGLDVFDIVNTLSILIKSTVYRNGGTKPIRRTTKICIAISDTIPPNLIRQALLIPDVVIGMLIGGTFTCDMIKEDVRKMLSGDFSTPKPVIELLKPKKGSIVKKHAIDLTPREQQILNLIQERGASNKIIAKMLDISESTVKLHVGKVLKKYGCKNRTQLALFSKQG